MDFEQRLVKRAKAGNVRARNQLLEMYRDAILFLTFDLLGDYTKATGAAQKAFQGVFDRINEFDDKESFSSCLYREAIKICRTLEQNLSQTVNTLNETKSQEQQLNEYNVVHIESNHKSENKSRQAINRTLQMLSFDQRVVIILRYYHKKTISCIARIMERNEDEVRTILYRAAESLKPVLNK